MKKIIFFSVASLLISYAKSQVCISVKDSCSGTTSYCFNCSAGNCGPFELSNGIYRIPFIDGTVVKVSNDHFNHCPRGRIDMFGKDGNGTYKVAAAADGWIRAIEDDNSIQCDCKITNCRNNYVWIEHTNGEWTKYTHMVKNSVTSLGHKVGDWVTAGTYLGIEGKVGCASGLHEHFEVAQLINGATTPGIIEYGGYINEDSAKNVIPVICSITGNVFVENAEYVAGPCGNCSAGLINTATTYNAGGYDAAIAATSISTSGNIVFNQYSSGLYQAGNYVRLDPGFEAKAGSEFTARVKPCNNFFAQNGSIAVEEIQTAKTVTENFRVYPNPASNQVTVEWSSNQEKPARLFLTDVAGHIVMELPSLKKINAGKMQVQFSTRQLKDGTYFVTLISDIKKHVNKLVVQHY
jgi:hypothetical protein